MDTIVPPPKAGKPPVPAHSECTVVVVCQGSADLGSWLAAWPHMAKYELLVAVLGGGPAPQLPKQFKGKVFGRADIEKLIGGPSPCLEGASLKSAVAALARSQFVIMLDASSQPAKDPQGKEVDPVVEHHLNLRTPATPFFFNTLYDPYREGADFVRGYPFSLRDGMVTAVSHGLWLGNPDLDAATAMVKPHMRNDRYVDATLTVPKSVLYSMSTKNLGYSRTALGVCMYTAPMVAGVTDGNGYDDVFAGWCAKVIADHLNMGHKTGLPYVTCQKVAGDVAKMQQQVAGWKEEAWKFFQTVKLSPESATPEAAYMELAGKVRAELSKVDAQFGRLADAMGQWVGVYTKLSAASV